MKSSFIIFLLLLFSIQFILVVSTDEVDTNTYQEKIKKTTKECLKYLEDKFEKMKSKIFKTIEQVDKSETDDKSIWNFKKVKPLWQPSSELIETDSNYIIKMELPGMKKENIKVELKTSPDDLKKSLQISGTKDAEQIEKDFFHHLKETFHGSFFRSWSFSNSKISDDVKAVYKDGVLNVELKKTEIAKDLQKAVEVK